MFWIRWLQIRAHHSEIQCDFDETRFVIRAFVLADLVLIHRKMFIKHLQNGEDTSTYILYIPISISISTIEIETEWILQSRKKMNYSENLWKSWKKNFKSVSG